MSDKDLQDARRAIAEIGIGLPMHFRSAVEGVQLLSDLLRLLLLFPEGELLIRRQVANLHPPCLICKLHS